GVRFREPIFDWVDQPYARESPRFPPGIIPLRRNNDCHWGKHRIDKWRPHLGGAKQPPRGLPAKNVRAHYVNRAQPLERRSRSRRPYDATRCPQQDRSPQMRHDRVPRRSRLRDVRPRNRRRPARLMARSQRLIRRDPSGADRQRNRLSRSTARRISNNSCPPRPVMLPWRLFLTLSLAHGATRAALYPPPLRCPLFGAPRRAILPGNAPGGG